MLHNSCDIYRKWKLGCCFTYLMDDLNRNLHSYPVYRMMHITNNLAGLDVIKHSFCSFTRAIHRLTDPGFVFQAQEVCQKCGQFWRAATLEGWRLYHDSNYEKLGPDNQLAPVEGNPYRDVWKKVCWNMANEVATGLIYFHLNMATPLLSIVPTLRLHISPNNI